MARSTNAYRIVANLRNHLQLTSLRIKGGTLLFEPLKSFFIHDKLMGVSRKYSSTNSDIFNRKSDKTVTNLDLTTKDNVTRDSFRLYCGFISYKQNDDITDINRIQEYEVKAGVTLDAAASDGRWGTDIFKLVCEYIPLDSIVLFGMFWGSGPHKVVETLE